jgi:hypothetical protein
MGFPTSFHRSSELRVFSYQFAVCSSGECSSGEEAGYELRALGAGNPKLQTHALRASDQFPVCSLQYRTPRF